MSQENVELARAVFEAFNRRDFDATWNAGDMGALRELHDPSVIRSRFADLVAGISS